MTVAAQQGRSWRRWLRRLWPLGLLLLGWLIAPLRSGAAYPGMPCTAQADTVFTMADVPGLIPGAATAVPLIR